MKDIRTVNADMGVFKTRLSSLPISAHLTAPQSAAFNTQGFPGWSQYDFAFDDYINIGTSDCQIVYNETPQTEGFIDSAIARCVLCAMYKQKSIIMLHVPVFGDDVDEFSKALINAKLDKIYICNVQRLDTTDLSNFLRDVSGKVINYHLNNHDLGQIKHRVQAHLRQLQTSN